MLYMSLSKIGEAKTFPCGKSQKSQIDSGNSNIPLPKIIKVVDIFQRLTNEI